MKKNVFLVAGFVGFVAMSGFAGAEEMQKSEAQCQAEWDAAPFSTATGTEKMKSIETHNRFGDGKTLAEHGAWMKICMNNGHN